MNNKKYEILKVLVGSHAHGLATPESDYDYRGVYVIPTKDILSLGFNYKGSHWIEGETEDNTSYEIGHFLHLATKCNPTILEVFKAPEVPLLTGFMDDLNEIKPSYQNIIKIIQDNGATKNNLYGTHSWIGQELRELFPYLWNPQDAFNAFTGYGLNQRKKMLDNHLDRWNKYGVAYIRTLNNLIDLLETGTFSLTIFDCKLKEEIIKIRDRKYTLGEIINLAEVLTITAKAKLEKHLNGTASFKQEQNLEKVNEFLLKIRGEFWE